MIRDMYKHIWNDLTPLGKWTIAIPTIIASYFAVVVIAPFAFFLWLALIKTGAAFRIERTLERIEGWFINKGTK